MNKITFVLLLLITLVAIYLRFYGLSISPPSLNWDEAAIGYNSYSLLHTGRDEYGKILPIFTRSFDDYKPAMSSYLMMPLIALLGLNEVSVRSLSAIAGTLMVIVIFLIARKTFKSNQAALLSALFVAISPFAVYFSRIMFEANVATSFFMLGILLYLYRDKFFNLYLSVFFLILSMYTYHSFKVLVPLVLLTLVFLSGRNPIELAKKGKGVIVLILAMFLPLFILTLQGIGAARFENTNILLHWPFSIISQALQGGSQALSVRFMESIPGYFLVWEELGRYIGHFSPMNLFIRGSLENPMVIPGNSDFFPFQFILWLVGLIVVFTNFKKYRLLGLLILLAPLPAIINWNWFYAARIIQVFVLYCLVMGLGAEVSVRYLAGRIFKFLPLKVAQSGLYFILAAISLWSSLYLFDSLMVLTPKFYYGNWQPGFKESIPVIAKLAENYDQVIIDTPQGEPYIFTLFYQAYHPEKYLSEIDYQQISKVPRGYYDFGKYHFRKIYWPTDRWLSKTIFMGNSFSLPEQDIKQQKNARIIKDILDPDQNIMVRIVTLD